MKSLRSPKGQADFRDSNFFFCFSKKRKAQPRFFCRAGALHLMSKTFLFLMSNVGLLPYIKKSSGEAATAVPERSEPRGA